MIQNFITEKLEKLSTDPKNLFNEAILCYKVEAYRASLLFSYLGYLTIIKELIIASKKPDNILQSRWDNIIKQLNDEDQWEQRVFNELVNSSTPIFNISDSIRQQAKYWKDRRNDCAHFKENEINNSHVEIFWSFLKSNLPKITIEGGLMNLLKKFQNHFDETKTPPNSDYAYLIKEIENSIELNEAHTFFQKLDKIIDVEFWISDEKIAEIYYNLFLNIDNPVIRESLLKFIKFEKRSDLLLLREKANFITFFQYDDKEIRQLWKSRIRNQNRLEYYILAILLRNNLIPNSELNEAITDFYNNFDQDGFNNIPNDESVKIGLATDQLLDLIYQKFFIEKEITTSKFGHINSKSDLIELLFEYRELDFEMVDGIVKMYENDINPWWLTSNLNTLFKNKPSKRTKFQEICDANDLDFPSRLE